MKLAELYALVMEAERAVMSATGRVNRRPWGTIQVAPQYPAVHTANNAWVDRVPKSGISQVLLELDQTMRAQGVSFRRIWFADPKVAHKVQDALVEMGYAPGRGLAMVRLGTSACIRNPDLEIRLVDTPEERDVFDAIHGELHAEAGESEDVSRQLMDRMRARTDRLKERPYLGLIGGEGAGVANLVPRDKLALVGDVGTRPKHRRRGVARTIVEEVSNLGQQMGLPYVGLTVAWENEAARALYTSLGYQPVGEVRWFHLADAH